MKKRTINPDDLEREVDMIKGRPSMLLADKCSDRRTTFPSVACVNIGCDYAIRHAGYLNCSFVAGEAGFGMTLEEVGATLDLTRERVRQIEMIACRKVKMRVLEDETTQHQPTVAPGRGVLASDHEGDERSAEHHVLRVVHGRGLG